MQFWNNDFIIKGQKLSKSAGHYMKKVIAP